MAQFKPELLQRQAEPLENSLKPRGAFGLSPAIHESRGKK